MLLSHTSGQGYDFLIPRIAAWRKENPNNPDGQEGKRAVDKAFDYPLAFHPGGRVVLRAGTGLGRAGGRKGERDAVEGLVAGEGVRAVGD